MFLDDFHQSRAQPLANAGESEPMCRSGRLAVRGVIAHTGRNLRSWTASWDSWHTMRIDLISGALIRRSTSPCSVLRRSLVALVTLFFVGACAETIEVSAFQRALTACFGDHGIDAVPLDGGAVHFDREGSLTKDESFALAETCAARVRAMGLLPPPNEPTDDQFKSQYANLAEVRECLLDLGFAIPDLVSFDEFMTDPSVQPHPYSYLAVGNNDLERVYSRCPDGGDVTEVRINP